MAKDRRGHTPAARIRSVRQCRLGAAYHLRRAERGEISVAEAKAFAHIYRQLSELVMTEKQLEVAGMMDVLATDHPDGTDAQLEPSETRRHVSEKAKIKLEVAGQELELTVDGPAAAVEVLRQVALTVPLMLPDARGSGSADD